MDHATFHKQTDIQKLIEDTGHQLEELPASSPDEHQRAQSKALWKQKK